FNAAREEGDWEDENWSLQWVNMRSGYSFIAWQCGPRQGRLTPFHDERVRQGMTMILDRERMIRDIWDGIDGQEFQFELTMSTGGEIGEQITSYVRNQCTRAGIRCSIRLVDWSIFADLLKQRDFDALMMGWSASAPESDPRQIWHSESILDQGDNFIQWSNEDADSLIDRIRATLDTGERMDLWHEFHSVVHESQPYTFIRVSPWLRFVKGDIGNVNTYKAGLDRTEFFRAGQMVTQPGS
ncbi:MAG: hypothetical protein ACO307_18805, partial [Ilumatobacteraceae bacterium]